MKLNKNITYALAAIAIGLALYASSLYSYLLFHGMTELFSIAIALSVFVVAWNTRKFLPNTYLLYIGIAFLFVAFIDILHTLAYKGMGVFTGYDANLPTQLWIAGRYIQAVSLLAAPYFIGRKVKALSVVILYSLASAVLLLSIFNGAFPDAFVEGKGLTMFKIISEYIISLMLAAAIIYLRKKREYFEKSILDMLIWAMIATIASEMAFTLYIDVYGFFNLLGHYFKIASYYLLYAAIIRTNLRMPFESLQRWEQIFEHAGWGVVLVEPVANTIVEANPVFAAMHGYTLEEMRGMDLAATFAVEARAELPGHARIVLEKGRHAYESIHLRKDGTTFPVLADVSVIRDAGGKGIYRVANIQDITERKKISDALEKSESLLQQTQQISRVGGWEYDVGSGRFSWTDEVYRIYGVSPDEHDQNDITQDIAFYEDRAAIENAFRRAVEFAEPYDLELKFRNVGGESLWVRTIGKAEQKDGKTVRVFGNIIDITERKRAQEALHESEERFRRAVDNIPDVIVIYDRNLRIQFINNATRRITGRPTSDFIGRCEEEIWPLEVYGVYLPMLQETLKTRTIRSLETNLLLPNGVSRILQIMCVPLIDEKGEVKEILGITHDFTERMHAVEELRITNEELLSINRIITTTTTTTTTGVKELLEKVLDEALNITGLEGGTICMVTPDKTLHLAAHRETSEATIFDLTTNEIKIGECLCGECARDHKPLILQTRDDVLKFATREATRGEDICFHAAYPLVIGERCLGVLCVFTRTDKKPAERRLKLLETVTAQIAIAVDNAQMFEEISRHAAMLEDKVKERTESLLKSREALTNMVEDLDEKSKSLQEANIKLQEVDKLKSMFIASMSHELRTPLNSIIGFSSILLDEWLGTLNEEQKMNLSAILRSGRHLLALINDVIDVSKIEAGMIDIHEEDFDLDDVIKEAANLFTKETKDKGLVLKVESIHQKMHADKRRLLQCVTNLVSNAVKFTEKGVIRIQKSESGSQNKKYIEIIVEDTGIGIRQEDIPKLFDAFVRLESPLKSIVPGTGLGLYLTKKLATEVLKGDIMVESTYGTGSRFTIRIPVNL